MATADCWLDYGDLASAAAVGRDDLHDDRDDEIYPIGGRPGKRFPFGVQIRDYIWGEYSEEDE